MMKNFSFFDSLFHLFFLVFCHRVFCNACNFHCNFHCNCLLRRIFCVYFYGDVCGPFSGSDCERAESARNPFCWRNSVTPPIDGKIVTAFPIATFRNCVTQPRFVLKISSIGIGCWKFTNFGKVNYDLFKLLFDLVLWPKICIKASVFQS